MESRVIRVPASLVVLSLKFKWCLSSTGVDEWLVAQNKNLHNETKFIILVERIGGWPIIIDQSRPSQKSISEMPAYKLPTGSHPHRSGISLLRACGGWPLAYTTTAGHRHTQGIQLITM